MKAIRVGADFYVNADKIELVQPWPSRPAIRERKRALEVGRFYDATGGKKIMTLLTLSNGWVIASGYNSTTLIQRPIIAAPIRASVKRGSKPTIEGREEAMQVFGPSDEELEEIAFSGEGEIHAPKIQAAKQGATTPDKGDDKERHEARQPSPQPEAPAKKRGLFRRQ